MEVVLWGVYLVAGALWGWREIYVGNDPSIPHKCVEGDILFIMFVLMWPVILCASLWHWFVNGDEL